MESKFSDDSTPVAEPFLKVRLQALRASQNPDGGWGYFPKKESWLEPTAYAAMALHGEAAADRAWKLISSWQQADGSWKPSSKVVMSSWATSLCVLIALARGESGESFNNGVNWLLASSGVETGVMNRILVAVGLVDAGRNISLKGWPWKPGTTSWVEPTSHAIVALRKASLPGAAKQIQERVRTGRNQLLECRSKDGGWNYGSPDALGVDLPSYPETTALALVGLQGTQGLESAFEVAGKLAGVTPSPLARAWLTIAKRLHGLPVNEAETTGGVTPDVMITSIEALSAPEGNWKLMQTEGAV